MKLLLIFCKEKHSYKWEDDFFIYITYKTLFNRKYILRQEKIRTNFSFLLGTMMSIANNLITLTELFWESKKAKENIYLN